VGGTRGAPCTRGTRDYIELPHGKLATGIRYTDSILGAVQYIFNGKLLHYLGTQKIPFLVLNSGFSKVFDSPGRRRLLVNPCMNAGDCFQTIHTRTCGSQPSRPTRPAGKPVGPGRQVIIITSGYPTIRPAAVAHRPRVTAGQVLNQIYRQRDLRTEGCCSCCSCWLVWPPARRSRGRLSR
jgi:hypothetical protein